MTASEWTKQDGTLIHKNACKELGLTDEQVINAIKQERLQHRLNSALRRVVRNSNAIVALTAQLTAILSGKARNMKHVRRFHIEYFDCLPILK